MIHNLSDDWLHKIDYPLWSVATEWQIYFIFALLLLPLWRRYGLAVTIAAALTVGYSPRLLLHHRLDGACFHFLCLFTFGMVAAVIAFSETPKHKVIANHPIWERMCAGALLIFMLLATTRTKWLLAHFTLHDILIGITTATMLLVLARQSQKTSSDTNSFAIITRVLEAHPIVVLGRFSYSLYLIHAPLLALIFSAVLLFHLSITGSFLVCEAVGVPFVVVVSYIFHLAFERPFMHKTKSMSEVRTEIEAIVSPAP